jgi:branched-chain amino acid transport system ATP-binding protein
MFRIANLNVSIGPIPIVRGASFAIEQSEMCGLIGRNGSGKTTLLRAIMGAIPANGIIEIDRTNLLALPTHLRVAHCIGYMPEDRRLVPDFTVEENVLLPALSLKMRGADQRVLANLRTEGISVLLAESNEVHVIDLLSRTFRIERGSVQ